jgi:Mn2+/Fe2+ NRAMP family transporter
MISTTSPLPAPNPMLAVAVAVAVAVTLGLAPELELTPAPAPLTEFAAATFALTPPPALGPALELTFATALAAAALKPGLTTSTTGVAVAEEEGGGTAIEANADNAEAKDDAPPRRPSP